VEAGFGTIGKRSMNVRSDRGKNACPNDLSVIRTLLLTAIEKENQPKVQPAVAEGKGK
jgi:hypothetical protein